jgi:hypothetical protein
MDHHRRSLLASLVALGVLASGAPAAQAAFTEDIPFGAGTVKVVDTDRTVNTVELTVTPAAGVDINSIRLFVDTFGTGRSHMALSKARAVYTPASTESCQVFDGIAFPEADVIDNGTSLTFHIRKDELDPEPRFLLDDGADTARSCTGVNGAIGRLGDFATEGKPLTPPNFIDWDAPEAPYGLTATGVPHAIVLSWNPPADAVGVRYQIWEPGRTEPTEESVSGTSFTIQGVPPGTSRAFQLRAYRFWSGRLFSAFTTFAGATATDVPPPPPTGATARTAVRGASAASPGGRRSAARRLAAPKAARARATRNRVTLTLPKIPKGSKLRISRATGKKGAFTLRSTTSRRTWVDRRVKRGATYRYRLVRMAPNGQRSLASKPVTVRVPRR